MRVGTDGRAREHTCVPGNDALRPRNSLQDDSPFFSGSQKAPILRITQNLMHASRRSELLSPRMSSFTTCLTCVLGVASYGCGLAPEPINPHIAPTTWLWIYFVLWKLSSVQLFAPISSPLFNCFPSCHVYLLKGPFLTCHPVVISNSSSFSTMLLSLNSPVLMCPYFV